MVGLRSQENRALVMTTTNAMDLGTGIPLPGPFPACPRTSCPVCVSCAGCPVPSPLVSCVCVLESSCLTEAGGGGGRWTTGPGTTKKPVSDHPIFSCKSHIRPTSLQASSPLKEYERFGEMTSGCWFKSWMVVWIWKDSITFTYGVNNDQMCCTSASICCAHGCSTSYG